MADTSYHPSVVSLNRSKPVYLNDLEIGQAASWKDVAITCRRFAISLFGERHKHKGKFDHGLESVRDLERLVGRNLHVVGHEFVEGPNYYRLEF